MQLYIPVYEVLYPTVIQIKNVCLHLIMCYFPVFSFLVTMLTVSFYAFANTVHAKDYKLFLDVHTNISNWIDPFPDTFLLEMLKYCRYVLCEHDHVWGKVFFPLRLFICLFWAVNLSSMAFFLCYGGSYSENGEKTKTISMLKCFSLDLSFKLYSNTLLNVLQTVGSHACVISGVFAWDSDVTLPHLTWNVAVWFHALRRNLNVFSVLGYK